MKSENMPYIICDDIESLIKKIDRCANNPEKSSTTKIDKYLLLWISMSTIWVFDNIENKHTLYRREDCMKEFCESLREHAKNILILKRKTCSH